jgi:LmbE family N-acetylglucosaminyl deacetylase
MDDLGTVLMIWAHPDDETYLAGGLSTLLTEAGGRVACITATRGEAGVSTATPEQVARLAQVRTEELDAALRILGVHEHHWLDHPDGACEDVDPVEAADSIAAILDQVAPDTVITFGPDGFTGHPDHQAVSAWTDLALARVAVGPRLLHAVAREGAVDWELAEELGVYELGLPRVCTDDELDVLVELDGSALERKVEALLRQESQTGRLVQAIGVDRFRTWVAQEAFAVPLGT